MVDNVMTVQASTSYAGSYIYKGNLLEMIFQPEGYVEPDGNGGFKYAFQYKDHLGNVRLSYSDLDLNGAIDPSTEILDENNYYPFGLKHMGYNYVVQNSNSTASNFSYGGKELQDELGLAWHDFGARNYDASIGRWMNIDPLAEKYSSNSTYTYALNSPVVFVDPNGMEVVFGGSVSDEDRKLISQFISFFRENSKTFNDAYTALDNSENIYTITTDDPGDNPGATFSPKFVGKQGTFEMETIIEDDGEEYDSSNYVETDENGGYIYFPLAAIRNEIGGDDGGITKDGLPEEFFHAAQWEQALKSKGAKTTSDLWLKFLTVANYEFEAKALVGITRNQSGVPLNKGGDEVAQRYGIQFSNQNFSLNKYTSKINEWLNDSKTNKGYKNRAIENSPPSLLIELND